MQAWIYSTTKIGQRFPGILLTPTATSTLSPADSKTILSKGLAVIDCSWNHLDKTAVHRAEILMIC
uniref:16S/18S rRNA aminocarboxypropyltransferase Tsr3 C-terminal domain-containing protein n=1 Tax=Meloidogyne enterolobii TaxID=390850 RepID=A0A6V7W6C3_MELEN|nr:unnamed protein product [Meloidogyne enterolobii]